MQFDILNDIITSTVFNLFTPAQMHQEDIRNRVIQFECLISQNNYKQSKNLFSIAHQSQNQKQKKQHTYQLSKDIWMQNQAIKIYKQALFSLNLSQQILQKNRKSQFKKYIENMSLDTLKNQKRKVKNQLKKYDDDFKLIFKKQPNQKQKYPLYFLYAYYSKLKKAIIQREEYRQSQQIIQTIKYIKIQRCKLRQIIQQYQKKIKFTQDIAPIQVSYIQYKSLKNDLVKYENMLKQ